MEADKPARDPGLPLPHAVIAPREKPRAAQAFVRFGVVGLVGVGVNLGVLELLHGFGGWGFLRSSVIATEVAIVANYAGNELWTFHHRQLNLGRLLRFNAAAFGALAITALSANFLKEHIHYLLAQTIGIGLGAGANFAANFLWTWRR